MCHGDIVKAGHGHVSPDAARAHSNGATGRPPHADLSGQPLLLFRGSDRHPALFRLAQLGDGGEPLGFSAVALDGELQQVEGDIAEELVPDADGGPDLLLVEGLAGVDDA